MLSLKEQANTIKHLKHSIILKCSTKPECFQNSQKIPKTHKKFSKKEIPGKSNKVFYKEKRSDEKFDQSLQKDF